MVHSPGLSAMIRAQGQFIGLGHYPGRGNNATQARALSNARDTPSTAYSGPYGNGGWSVEANVPSLEQAGQGTPWPPQSSPFLRP